MEMDNERIVNCQMYDNVLKNFYVSDDCSINDSSNFSHSTPKNLTVVNKKKIYQ